MLAFDKLFENKTLMFAAGAAAFLVAALLILFIFRLAFGRRLHMPGSGRARQPRLGIVDAFDLDRQRQLVLVRRDNIEHLVMIGGPNDILIEAQIVRAEAREDRRNTRERDGAREKEPTVAPLTWPGGSLPASPAAPPPAAAPLPAAAPVPTAALGEPKLTPEELPIAIGVRNEVPLNTTVPPPLANPPQGPAIAPVGPAKRPPFAPLPPRKPLSTPFGVKPVSPTVTPPIERPVEALPAENRPAENRDAVTIVAPAPAVPRLATTPPSFLRPRPATPPPPLAPPPLAPPAAVPETNPPPVAPEIAAAEITAPVVAAPVVDQPAKSPSQADALESLEEEMAKLLGRPTKDS